MVNASAAAQSGSANAAGAAPAAKSGMWKLILAGGVVAIAAAGFFGYKHLNSGHELNLQKMRIAKLTDSGKARLVAISPDGRYVVYVLRDGEQQSLWVRNVATKSDVQVLAPDEVNFAGVSFSPDGNYIYFTRSDKSTTLYNFLYSMPVLGGSPRQVLRDIDSPVSFSPGRQTVLVHERSTRQERDRDSDRERGWQRRSSGGFAAVNRRVPVRNGVVAGRKNDCSERAAVW